MEGYSMGWIEVIRLRIPHRGRTNVLRELKTLFKSCHRTKGGPSQITILMSLQPAGDIALVLSWPEEGPDTQPSRLSLSLSTELKKYGLVNSSAWIEPPSSHWPETAKKGE
jgi:hypothetical protein